MQAERSARERDAKRKADDDAKLEARAEAAVRASVEKAAADRSPRGMKKTSAVSVSKVKNNEERSLTNAGAVSDAIVKSCDANKLENDTGHPKEGNEGDRLTYYGIRDFNAELGEEAALVTDFMTTIGKDKHEIQRLKALVANLQDQLSEARGQPNNIGNGDQHDGQPDLDTDAVPDEDLYLNIFDPVQPAVQCHATPSEPELYLNIFDPVRPEVRSHDIVPPSDSDDNVIVRQKASFDEQAAMDRLNHIIEEFGGIPK